MASISAMACHCKNTCNRSTKRGACPCRAAGKRCTDLCSCGFSLPCINRETSRPPAPIPSCRTDLFENSPSRQGSDLLQDTDSQSTRRFSTLKRKKGTRGTAAKKTKQNQGEAQDLLASPTSPAQSSVCRRLQVNISAIEESPASRTPARRKLTRKTSTPRNSQAASRPTPATQHKQTVENFAAQLDESSLRKIVVELLTRDQGAFQDYVQGYIPDPPQSLSPQPESPAWCRCGNCRPMPAEAENKCCMGRGAVCCATEAPNFYLVVEPAVLDLAIAHYNDFMVHAAYRHQAYRQYILQRFGRLGAGNRRVVPSCVVIAVRSRFPDPQGHYTGFLDV